MRFTIFLIAGVLFSIVALGQDRHCYTSEVSNQLIQDHPELIKAREQLEQFTKQYISQQSQKRSMADAQVYIIPLVFHIIHNYGPEDISDAQVTDAVRILNLDYRKLNADTGDVVPAFKSIAADCDIEFRLANIDPNGNCTNGIDRIASSLTNNADDHSKLNPWPDNKYLNIWVVNSLSNADASAYAYYPWALPSPMVDGVIVIHSYVGSIGTSSAGTSRVITHEIGHCLNLKHPWGDTNSPGIACGDDSVADTPITKGWAECDITGLSCLGTQDNVQNYMEYSYCCNMFTQDQKIRMLAALNSSSANRNNLWSSSNLTATGTDNPTPAVCPPKADFTVNPNFICEGVSVQFQDLSWNGKPTSWSWSFPGGTPSSSTDSTPVVFYSSPSTNPYNVTLTVSNTEGFNSVTKISVIAVSGSPDNSVPYSQDFESSSSFPGNGGFVINPDNRSPAWTRTTSAGYSGTSSIMINNYSGNVSGQVDFYITPSFDLSHATHPALLFEVANAQRNSQSNDLLKVYVSIDCGATWTQRYSKSGSVLSTAGITGTNFVPTSAQWRTETINLSSLAGAPNLRVKFENTSDAGNNTYIDDINIPAVLGINEVNLTGLHFDIYPNPSKGESTVSFDLKEESSVSISMHDIVGQEINLPVDEGTYKVLNRKLNAGLHYINVNTANLSGGIYFVDLTIDGALVVKKLIVE